MLHLIHGSSWNDTMRVMLDPVSEDEARAQYASGQRIAVAGAPEPLLGIDPETYDGPDGEEPATWSLFVRGVDGGTDAPVFADVTFYNLWGLKEARYAFQATDDGRLFLMFVDEYRYDDPTDPDARWSGWTQYRFQPDGYSKEVVTEMLPDRTQDVTMTEYRGGDFSSHFEPVPEFGEWAGVLRRQR